MIAYAFSMTAINITEARKDLYQLVAKTAKDHKPLTIKGKHNNAVLLSEEDWNAIQETLYLLSVPGMRESIHKGMAQSLKECSDEPGW